MDIHVANKRAKQAVNYLLLNRIQHVHTFFHCKLKVWGFAMVVNTSVYEYILFHASTLWLAQVVTTIDSYEKRNQVFFIRYFLLNKIKILFIVFFICDSCETQ